MKKWVGLGHVLNATALGRSATAETFFAVLGCGDSFIDPEKKETISTIHSVQYFLNLKVRDTQSKNENEKGTANEHEFARMGEGEIK